MTTKTTETTKKKPPTRYGALLDWNGRTYWLVVGSNREATRAAATVAARAGFGVDFDVTSSIEIHEVTQDLYGLVRVGERPRLWGRRADGVLCTDEEVYYLEDGLSVEA